MKQWLQLGGIDSFSILGGSAHPKTRYVSWVQNDVNQFGSPNLNSDDGTRCMYDC